MANPAPRIVLAKVGLDGHDRGIKVVARGLRDLGFHVIYAGLWQSPEAVVRAVADEDAGWLGLSLLSGAHMTLVPRVLERMRQAGLGDVGVLVGGIIPEQDGRKLIEFGVARVFGPGTALGEIAEFIRGQGTRRHEPLVERSLPGDRGALSRLLTAAARGEGSEAALGPARVIAVTGSGGVGKSTLIGKLIEVIRRAGRTVAVLACDPQSPLTGGALLGDRIRMPNRPDDDGVFIRSLATPGGRSGVAANLELMIGLFGRFGFDTVIVETVGAGQGDTAIRETADVVIVLVQPETGDELQWEKAGQLEIADIVVVHKADLPSAERTLTQLRELLNLPGCRPVPVVRVSSSKGLGVEELWAAIDACPGRPRAVGTEVGSSWDPWTSIPQEFNLGEALTRGQVAAGRGPKAAIHWENAAGARRTLAYGELDAATSRLASSLARLGVQRSDRVFLRLPNIPEFYVAALAVAKLGGVFIPSSTQFRASEVEYRLKDSGATAAITTSGLVDVIDLAAATIPELKRIIVVPYPDPDPKTLGAGHIEFGRLVSAGSEAFASARTRSDDIAFIAYTSGTTGDPKGVVHYHRYPISYEGLVRHWHDYRPDDVVACPSELGWLLPVASTFLYALVRGLTVVLYDAMGGRFDAERWFTLFQNHRITNFTAPPTIYRMMVAAAGAANRFNLSCWRHAVSAGEPLPADTIETFQRQFGITLRDGIGMSECMVYCFGQPGMPLKPGSCGRPGPGTVIELMDDEMHPVPVGAEGVLCVRRDTHPGMMKEYWNKPEQTAEIFRGEWYCSGDVLVRDEDGDFWFRGRNDDVIKASGYRISPFEVESGLVSHPAVLEAAAVESPDPVRGMVVKAFVVLRERHPPSDSLAEEIQEHVKRTIAPYKYPRRIEFVAALPKTTSGKIKRRELRELEHARATGGNPIART